MNGFALSSEVLFLSYPTASSLSVGGWAIPRNSLKKNSLVRKGDIKGNGYYFIYSYARCMVYFIPCVQS